MDAAERLSLERALGRQLAWEDHASIASLNEVPPALIVELRRMDETQARAVLRHYTEASRAELAAFIAAVVRGDTKPDAWLRGGALVLDVSLREQLLRPLPELLAPLEGNFQHRVVPSLESWRAGVSWVGAPAVPVPNADYRSPGRPGTVRLLAPMLEPVPEPVSAARRWIAARLARVLSVGGNVSLGETLRVDDVSDEAGPIPTAHWTGDACVAARALQREIRDFGIENNGVPGFRGPDDWFA